MSTTDDVPEPVAAAYALDRSSIQRIVSLINLTFSASRVGNGQRLIVQRLHPVFDASLHHDVFAITQHLKACGLETPELVTTADGQLWFEAGNEVWRAQTHIPGSTVHRVTSPAMARSAGCMVAKFHRCLSNFEHTFAFERGGVHDTQQHLERLREARKRARDRGDRETCDLAGSILAAAETVELDFSSQPRRLCHGDLKISNVLFQQLDPPVARCLIDLDTLGYLPLAHELGDALRSWCNPGNEDSTTAHLEPALFEAALDGYAEAAPENITAAEWSSVVPGLSCICLELAARFCVDAVEDSYFGWDPSRFATRREHNLERARGQLSLAKSVTGQRGVLEGVVRSLLPTT